MTAEHLREVNLAVIGAAGGAYVSGDAVGASPIAVPSLKKATTDTDFWIETVNFYDLDNQKIVGELWVFDGAPAGVADNAAFAPTDADSQKVITVIDVAAADYDTAGANAVARVAVQKRFQCTGVPNVIYVTRGTPTYTQGLQIDIYCDPD
jgi:hypothetical protein